jgi:hypothetical protein
MPATNANSPMPPSSRDLLTHLLQQFLPSGGFTTAVIFEVSDLNTTAEQALNLSYEQTTAVNTVITAASCENAPSQQNETTQ